MNEIDKNKFREFREEDLVIGNSYYTFNKNNELFPMKIRNYKDVQTVLNTLNKHKKYIKYLTDETFINAGLTKNNSIILPNWYNVDDDTNIYTSNDIDEFENFLIVYHSKIKKISMFTINKTEHITQIYQNFIGIKVETENDFHNMLPMFARNEKKAKD